MIIRGGRAIRGRILMPGDKSISHRAAMVAALAEGTSSITNFSTRADCAAPLSCLKHLGVSIERENVNLFITGVGSNRLQTPQAPLECGNSGTAIRFLEGLL